ncbi:MAG: M23 family metallopeptidase [Acidobacteriota bacterium]|nr:M23 family metallopeptidase [Acidobacteriota bacterium]
MDEKVKIATIALIALLVGIPIVLMLLSTGTLITVNPPVKVIGIDTPVRVELKNAHGIREVAIKLEQDSKTYPVFSEKKPAHRFLFFGEKNGARDVIARVGKNKAPALKDGKAQMIVEATANDLRGQTDRKSFDVDIITTAPHVAADGEQHYINQGGSELVVFTPSGYWTDSGVEVGQAKYRSYPLPSRPEKLRFSLFAYPWDTPPTTIPVVYASNGAGPEATAAFFTKITPKSFRSRDIVLDDKFLNRVVPAIDPQGTGDLLARFLHINRDLRRQNNQTIADLRLKTEPRMLWTGAFLPLANSQVESVFADRRSYIYHGKKVDEQVHLGFDLAKVAHTPIPASNDGRILWAGDLGIYGNCVVIDHGYGLQSIYGHLSEIEVKVGDMVKRGQEIGRSGATGLAGGDHLHYSMQVDGTQVNPVEWWDAHWIHDRILSKLK